MRIQYLDSNARLHGNRRNSSHHQDNLNFLEENTNLDSEIRKEVGLNIDGFVRHANSQERAYINSGEIAQSTCNKLGLPQDIFYHGLVGSALNDEISRYNSPIVVIASKGLGQTWFDYFPSEEE